MPWRPTEAPLERCILYLRGFCGPYESTANSNQNVPWSVPNGAQETPKDTQETASNQSKPPRTPKLTLRDNKWHQRDNSAPQGSPRRVPKGPLESSKMPQERHWTPQKGPQRNPNHCQMVPGRPTEALLERCILHLRGFRGPCGSTTNSNQNVPWSVPIDAQETPKDIQETASDPNDPPRNSQVNPTRQQVAPKRH